jgi:hypothetical protein
MHVAGPRRGTHDDYRIRKAGALQRSTQFLDSTEEPTSRCAVWFDDKCLDSVAAHRYAQTSRATVVQSQSDLLLELGILASYTAGSLAERDRSR